LNNEDHIATMNNCPRAVIADDEAHLRDYL